MLAIALSAIIQTVEPLAADIRPAYDRTSSALDDIERTLAEFRDDRCLTAREFWDWKRERFALLTIPVDNEWTIKAEAVTSSAVRLTEVAVERVEASECGPVNDNASATISDR